MGATAVVVSVLGLLTQHFLACSFSKEDYGRFHLDLAWIALLGFFALNSFNTVVTKASAQGYPQFFNVAFKYCLGFSILGTIILISLNYYLEGPHFLILAVFFPFYAGLNLSESYLIGKGRFNDYSLLAILSGALRLLSVVILLSSSLGLRAILIGYLAVTAVVNIITCSAIAWKHTGACRNPNTEEQLIRFGLLLTALGVVLSVASRLQYILLSIYSTPAALATYAAASILPEKGKEMLKNVCNPVSIHLASIARRDAVYAMKKLLYPALLAGIIWSGFLAAMCYFLIPLIFGKAYADAVNVAMMLSSVQFVAILNAFLGSVIVYHGYQKYYSALSIVGNIVQIVLFAALVPGYQIKGIVIAIGAVNVVMTLFSLVCFRKIHSSFPRLGERMVRIEEVSMRALVSGAMRAEVLELPSSKLTWPNRGLLWLLATGTKGFEKM